MHKCHCVHDAEIIIIIPRNGNLHLRTSFRFHEWKNNIGANSVIYV